MEDTSKLPVDLTKEELEIIAHALASTQPINRDLEVVQFKLYHRILFKLNDIK